MNRKSGIEIKWNFSLLAIAFHFVKFISGLTIKPSYIDLIQQKSFFSNMYNRIRIFFVIFICANTNTNINLIQCQQKLLSANNTQYCIGMYVVFCPKKCVCPPLKLCHTIDLTWIVFMSFLNKVNNIHPRRLNIAHIKEEKSTFPTTNRIMNTSNLMLVISSFEKKITITPQNTLLYECMLFSHTYAHI